MDGEDPLGELQRIQTEIDAATEYDQLRPIFSRLNALIQAYPDDLDIQVAGSELKQRIVARGTLLRQQPAPSPPPSPATSPPEAHALPIPGPAPAAAPAIAPPPTAPPRHFARLVVLAAGLLAVLAGGALLWRQIIRTRPVQVGIATTPPGASITVTETSGRGGNRQTSACTSDCKLTLAPGAYNVSASLAGYEPAVTAIQVAARQTKSVRLTLLAQPQSVRLLTDLDRGQVTLDDRPPADLAGGKAVFENLPPGAHTVTVTGPNRSASFQFETAPARLPLVTAVEAKDLTAVLVASFANRARIATNAGPWKLAVNGQPQGDAGPAGIDVTGFRPGVNDIVIGEGQTQRNLSESFGPAPTLTAFLKSDVNAGTLIVATGHDDVRIFLNGKEYRRRTRRGEARIQTLGKVEVRVAKSGFQDEPPQTVEVKKGAEVRVEFALKPQPQLGSLRIHGGIAGSEVVLDQKNAGSVGPDGTFSLDSLPAGDHTVELRREHYLPKRIPLSLKAGQTVVLGSAEAGLTLAHATLKFTRTPPTAVVTYRHSDESDAHEVHGAEVELPPGNYTIHATAPGYMEASTAVQLAPGESRAFDVTLVHERPKAPVPSVHGMDGFADPQSWKQDGDAWVHKGGGFVAYKLTPNGTFTFTVTPRGRGGPIRWCVQYLDPKNYLLYELDRKNFWAGVVQAGKRFERVKQGHNLGNQKSFSIQVEIFPDRAIQKVRVGDQWKVLDTFAEPDRAFTKGKFGFLLPGNDEIAITDFKFVER